MKEQIFVIYSNDKEIIVCTEGTEKEALKEWFRDAGRDLEEYDRSQLVGSAVQISRLLRV